MSLTTTCISNRTPRPLVTTCDVDALIMRNLNNEDHIRVVDRPHSGYSRQCRTGGQQSKLVEGFTRRRAGWPRFGG